MMHLILAHIKFFKRYQQAADCIDKEKLVTFYCRVGIRSQLAVQRLQEKFPFKNLYNLSS